nr:MAG TPA: hypothetical protein [Caudoviricetes sp.]
MRERMNKIVIALPGKRLRTRNRTADRLRIIILMMVKN